MVVGAVVPFYRLPSAFSQVNLVLTRELLVSIFIGNITRWNDPRLQAMNTLALPDARTFHTTPRSKTSNQTSSISTTQRELTLVMVV